MFAIARRARRGDLQAVAGTCVLGARSRFPARRRVAAPNVSIGCSLQRARRRGRSEWVWLRIRFAESDVNS